MLTPHHSETEAQNMKPASSEDPLIREDDPVLLVPSSPLSVQVDRPAPVTKNDLAIPVDYPVVPLITFSHVKKFALFVTVSYLSSPGYLLECLPMVASGAIGPEQRTLFLLVLIWNLIGASLFCRTKLDPQELGKDALIIFLIFGMPAVIWPILPALPRLLFAPCP